MLSRCFFDFSVGVRAFVIGLSQIHFVLRFFLSWLDAPDPPLKLVRTHFNNLLRGF